MHLQERPGLRRTTPGPALVSAQTVLDVALVWLGLIVQGDLADQRRHQTFVTASI